MGKKRKKNKEPDEDDDGPEEERPIRKSRKKLIITVVLVLILITVVLLIAFWGYSSSTGYLGVDEVVNNKEKYVDDHVEVKGTVERGSISTLNKTFNLTNGEDSLVVNYTGTLPSDMKEGTDVVVKGTLRDRNGLVLEADEIVVGCPSKY